MTERNSHWPPEPRAHVAYRPPFGVQQPTRAVALRDVWRQVNDFRERFIAPFGGETLMLTAQRWSAESLRNHPEILEWFGAWPPELTRADFDAAVHLARERFGQPKHSSDTRRLRDDLEEEHHWQLPLARVDELLEYLEAVAPCTVGTLASPILGRYGCAFRLRDPRTGAVLRGQTKRHFHIFSQIGVELRQRSTASLQLIIPFAEPDEKTADYVMAVQEHAPLWIDPRYFDHFVPEPDGSEYLYRGRRLPPEWIGRNATGELRLDASKSGIVPQPLDLPTADDLASEDREADLAPYRENFFAVYAALREHRAAALLVRGPSEGAGEFMVESSAEQLGMPVHRVRTLRLKKDAPTVAETIRTLVWGLEDRPAVLLVELVPHGDRTANEAILAQMATRTLDRATLPSSIRLVVLEETVGSDATREAGEREWEARREGFATREQLDYLDRRHSAAAYRDVEVIPVPYAP